MSKSQRALLSVSDKSGLVDLARGLAGLGMELISTGGTLSALEEAGVAATAVSEVTGFPELLDGRVKTLHPHIHGGILADRDVAEHRAALEEHEIQPIDLVVVNLYPFRRAAASTDASRREVVEKIDIGGPTLVRAAAKNHRYVTVVVDPGDYDAVLAALGEDDAASLAELRRRLAAKAFRHTQAYDAAIARWFADEDGTEDTRQPPESLVLHLERAFAPRYGENPHQAAAVYRTAGARGLLGGLTQHQGKELSYNNLLDADAARRLVAQFDEPPFGGPLSGGPVFAGPVAAIVKHSNPCGVGQAETPAEAYRLALACDPMSAFGSIVAVNCPADGDLARAMASLFVEVVLAPAFTSEALAIFAEKKNLRVLECPLAPSTVSGTGSPIDALELRGIDGGFLGQTPDTEPDPLADWSCVTDRQPSTTEEQALTLAWRVVRHVRSNAIVVANPRQTVGIGAGQMSRVDSCRIAIDKAQLPLAGTAAGSDAFFPFADGLEVLAEAGVTAFVQPGGSKRDPEVIAAANDRGLTMLLTGRRHFRH